MEPEWNRVQCPKCGATLNGKPSHCPICFYNFNAASYHFNKIPALFALSFSAYSFLPFFTVLFGYTFLIYAQFLYLTNTPILLVPELILIPALLSIRRYFSSFSKDFNFQFSSESAASFLGVIAICVAIVLSTLQIGVSGGYPINKGSSNLLLEVFINLIEYSNLVFLFLFAIIVYGIYKIGSILSNRIYMISSILILIGIVLSNIFAVADYFSAPLFNYFLPFLRDGLIGGVISIGHVLVGIFSLLLIIKNGPGDNTFNF